MPKKLKLDIDFSSDITLIAISCHKRDFWLAMQLNENLKTDLRRMNDLPYFHPVAKELLHYSLFHHVDENSGYSWFLIGNYNPDGKLFTELKGADFIIMLNSTLSLEKQTELIKKIKEIKGVLTAFQSDLNKIKDLKNFISDLELHMVEELKRK